MNKFEKIEEAVFNYQERLDTHIMEDGQMRWEKYGVQRRIAQAAVSYRGYIVTGSRHYCPIMCMQIDAIGQELLEEWAKISEDNGRGIVQGFTDQFGFFLNRKEAYIIAQEAGQIIFKDHCPGTLFSECYV